MANEASPGTAKDSSFRGTSRAIALIVLLAVGAFAICSVVAQVNDTVQSYEAMTLRAPTLGAGVDQPQATRGLAIALAAIAFGVMSVGIVASLVANGFKRITEIDRSQSSSAVEAKWLDVTVRGRVRVEPPPPPEEKAPISEKKSP